MQWARRRYTPTTRYGCTAETREAPASPKCARVPAGVRARTCAPTRLTYTSSVKKFAAENGLTLVMTACSQAPEITTVDRQVVFCRRAGRSERAGSSNSPMRRLSAPGGPQAPATDARRHGPSPGTPPEQARPSARRGSERIAPLICDRPGGYNQPRAGERGERHCDRSTHEPSREHPVDNLIWIIIVVLVVLALLGYFGRGRFRG
jgi:cobalamin biosynthesis Mg chelatase CobN